MVSSVLFTRGSVSANPVSRVSAALSSECQRGIAHASTLAPRPQMFGINRCVMMAKVPRRKSRSAWS
jgi:hypothetical protein